MSVPTTDSPKKFGAWMKYASVLIFVFAVALRLWGITWALPDATHAYSYHVDESVVVGHSLDLDPLTGKLDPNFYNYGSLTLLIDGTVIHAGRAAGLLSANPADFRPGGLQIPSASELLVARLISALLGAGTAVFLFRTGQLLYGNTAGIIAALGYAVAPLAVQHAHFATVDVPATFWIAGSIFFAARFLKAETLKPTTLLWCGLWAGLAAAAKYNGGLVVLAGAAAWWLVKPRLPLPLVLLCVGTAVGFVAGCPGIFLNPQALIRDVRFEANHVATGHGEVFTGTMPGFIYHIVFNMFWGLSLGLLLLCLAGVGIAIARRRPADGLLAAFALPYYILIGLAQVKFARYNLPLFPPILLFAGAAWEGWRNPKVQTAVRVGTLIASTYALLFSVALNQTMLLPDPRDQALAYIRSTETIQSVAFAAGPWSYSPPLHPLLSHPIPALAQEAAIQPTNKPTLVPSVRFGDDGQPLRDEHGFLEPVEWWTPLFTVPLSPDAIAFGELHYDDWLRTNYKDAETYLEEAEKRYPNHKDFTQPIALFGIPLVPIRTLPGKPWHGLPSQSLPHDMLYTNQSVSIWTK